MSEVDYAELQKLRKARLAKYGEYDEDPENGAFEGAESGAGRQVSKLASAKPKATSQLELLPPSEPVADLCDPKLKELALFQSFLANSEQERDALSTAFLVWDNCPKYFNSYVEQRRRRADGKYLDVVKHTFRFKHESYQIVITPAHIEEDVNGVVTNVSYLPGPTEQLVEAALVKLACNSAVANYDNVTGRTYGVRFSLNQIRTLLTEWGHGRTVKEIRRSLEILHKTNVRVISENSGKALTKSATILSSLSTFEDTGSKKNNPNAGCEATFHPMITEAIESAQYRQIRIEQVHKIRSPAARAIATKMLTLGLNVSDTVPFKIRFSEFTRDTGLLNYSRISDGIRKFRQAAQELVPRLATHIDENCRYGKFNAIKDIELIVYPSPQTIKDIKSASARYKAVHEHLARFKAVGH